jgi:hypothetical protein
MPERSSVKCFQPVVDGDHPARADQAAQFDGVSCRHRVPHRSRDREPDGAEVQQCRVDPEAGGDRADTVVSTVSPEIQRTPSRWPSDLRAKPNASSMVKRA